MRTSKQSLFSARLRSWFRVGAVAALMIPVAGLLWQTNAAATDSVANLPAPKVDASAAHSGSQTAVLAGGCFWGMETVFQHVKGVTSVVSGYAGGSQSNAQYRTVSTGTTNNAESVKITYDPAKVSYGKLLQVYFSVAHNPTQLNRQGPDTGPQYRSNIFYANPAQKKIAQAYIKQLKQGHAFDNPIVTRVDPLTGFYPAESYHQNYAEKHPNQLYIVYNDAPKVKHLKKMFSSLYRTSPVLVAAQ